MLKPKVSCIEAIGEQIKSQTSQHDILCGTKETGGEPDVKRYVNQKLLDADLWHPLVS